ncbi:hypothetical protein M2113_000606 [Aurantimicrobium minutum]|uniref:hypothetical protein n=1 Tax=Aurantimicrobium minutum TaxID=708131 RepID=UPI0024744C94|nr:hypothetical protein [Aurantimicrobium minutum]MDH6409645.1 hypothetical protein [Aurantimicrobium minutum]
MNNAKQEVLIRAGEDLITQLSAMAQTTYEPTESRLLEEDVWEFVIPARVDSDITFSLVTQIHEQYFMGTFTTSADDSEIMMMVQEIDQDFYKVMESLDYKNNSEIIGALEG